MFRAGVVHASSVAYRPTPRSCSQLLNTRLLTRALQRSFIHVDSVARSILKRHFGHDEFRSEQAAAIRTILQGQNALVVFPTGAGKSLCYQIPAVAFEELDRAGLTGRETETEAMGHGITIVISPLIALMKDQIDALQRRGIPADSLDSTKTYDQQRRIHAQIQQGRLKLLYCTPEKLSSEAFIWDMKQVPGGIRLVAIDEAHCISEWGHSFRPSYLKVARFVKEAKVERVICLTATATPPVAEDICRFFDIREANMFKTSPYRPNLELQVQVIKKREKEYQLLKFLETHDGATLVYVTARDEAEMLAAFLEKQGHRVAHFHANMSVKQKAQAQDDFMKGNIRIMVATIAFGMGIDKPDIRNVLHYDVPKTVEEYSQQVGRAGRDGKPSSCLLFLDRQGIWMKEYLIWGNVPSRQSLQRLLEDVFLLRTPAFDKLPACGDDVLTLNEEALAQKHDIRGEFFGTILAKIELRFGLIRAISSTIAGYRFQENLGYSTLIESDRSPEAQAITDYSKKVGDWYTVEANAVMNSPGLFRDIVTKLKDYHNRRAIKLQTLGFVQRYEVLKELPKTTDEIREVADQLYTEMEGREQDDVNRLRTLLSLLTDSKCFAWALAKHFGMDLPSGKSRCGHCSYCRTGKPAGLPHKPKPSVDLKTGVNKIMKNCDVRDDPRFLARLAFGIQSPRIIAMGLKESPLFGYLRGHSFESLLKKFTQVNDFKKYRKRAKKSRVKMKVRS